MITSLVLGLIASIGITASDWCDKADIACQIRFNQPSVSREYADELANIIRYVGIKHDVPLHVYTAILMQESGYKLYAKNCHKYGCDLGIAQIYEKTARAYGFETDRLMYDLAYSLEAGAIVLSYFKKRYAKKEPNRWFSRYNCGTKYKNVKSVKCDKYFKAVSRYL